MATSIVAANKTIYLILCATMHQKEGKKEQGWCSGESTCHPPVWPGFNSQARCQMWVEFVVGSRPSSKRFFFWVLLFPLSSKTSISKLQLDLVIVDEELPSGCATVNFD